MHVGRSDYRSFGGRVTAILEWKPGVEHYRLLLSRFLGREVEFTALAFLPYMIRPDKIRSHNICLFSVYFTSLFCLCFRIFALAPKLWWSRDANRRG